MPSGEGWGDAGNLYNVELAGVDPDSRKVFMVVASDPVEAIRVVRARWAEKWNTERVPISDVVSVMLVHERVLVSNPTS